MKVYVVYQLGYDGSELMEILGVYNNIKKAKQVYIENICENIENFDFDYDNECKLNVIELNKVGEEIKSNMVRLFKGGYQENWDNYLELHIEEREVL